MQISTCGWLRYSYKIPTNAFLYSSTILSNNRNRMPFLQCEQSLQQYGLLCFKPYLICVSHFQTVFITNTIADVRTNAFRAHLVFVQLAVLIFLFTLVLESDNNEADEDVHHKEGDDNDVDEIKESHALSRVISRTCSLFPRVNRLVQKSTTEVSDKSLQRKRVTERCWATWF